MKKESFIVVGLIALIAGLAIWFARKKETNAAKQSTTGSAASSCAFPLKFGNTKSCGLVTKMQKKLNQLLVNAYAPAIKEDGFWGNNTASAMREFGFSQYQYGPLTEQQYNEILNTPV